MKNFKTKIKKTSNTLIVSVTIPKIKKEDLLFKVHPTDVHARVYEEYDVASIDQCSTLHASRDEKVEATYKYTLKPAKRASRATNKKTDTKTSESSKSDNE